MTNRRLPYAPLAFDYSKYLQGPQPLDGPGYLTYFPWSAKECPPGRSVGDTPPIVVGNPSWYYALGGGQEGIFPAFGGWGGTAGTSIHLPRALVGGFDDDLLNEMRRLGVDCYSGLGGPEAYIPSNGGTTTGRFDDDNGNPRVWFPRPNAVGLPPMLGGDVYIYAPGVGDPGIGDSSGTETITTTYVQTYNDGPGVPPPDQVQTFGPFSPSGNTGGFDARSEASPDEVSQTGENCSNYMNPFDPFDPLTYLQCGYYRITVTLPDNIIYTARDISQPLYTAARSAWAPHCRKFRIAGGESDYAGSDFHGNAAQIAADIRSFFARTPG